MSSDNTITDINTEQLLDEKNFESFPTRFDYRKLFSDIQLNKLTKAEKRNIYRHLCKTDLYFLIRYAQNRPDVMHPWLYKRSLECKRVDNVIDLWAREHYKSTFKSNGCLIQHLLNNPDHGICTFSHTKKVASDFHKSLRSVLENSDFLLNLFPELFYPAGSDNYNDERIFLRTHSSGRKEPSLSYGGLIIGQPIGMHFDYLNYDDIVVEEGCNTPEQMEKLVNSFALSFSMGRGEKYIKTISGTRYHYADLFSDLMEQGDTAWDWRVYPAEDDWGDAVLFSNEWLADKRMRQGSYIYNCQYLLDPASRDTVSFPHGGYRTFTELPTEGIAGDAVLCDPALSKKGCYAVIMYVLVTADHRIYVDHYWSRRGTRNSQIVEMMYEFDRVYNPRSLAVETVGYQMAIKQDLEDRYVRETGRSRRIDELKPGGKGKDVRVLGLQSYYENGQIFIRDTMRELINETDDHPFHKYKDHIDLLAYVPQLFMQRFGFEIQKSLVTGNFDRTDVLPHNRGKTLTKPNGQSISDSMNRTKRTEALSWQRGNRRIGNQVRRQS